LGPAGDGNEAILGINADDDGVTVARTHRGGQVGVAHRRGAQHHALHPHVEQAGNRVQRPDTATYLYGDADGLQNRPERVEVDRLPGARAVEVDDVQPGRTEFGPLPRHRAGVIRVNGLLGVIALVETDAAPAAQVNR